MASGKRGADALDEPAGAGANAPKAARKAREIVKTASSDRPNRALSKKLHEPRSLRSYLSSNSPPPKIVSKKGSARSPTKTNGKARGRPRTIKDTTTMPNVKVQVDGNPVKASAQTNGVNHERPEDIQSDGLQYWLMKAEPESRIEKGKDVKFSIDDLEKATEPEAWDGVRNYGARNNMRSMVKGDQAFFYHSNCKIPGIAGIMEVVREHSVDESAFDPGHPYYDEKATRENPKWAVVHVKFLRKFPAIVPLKELQKFAKSGGTLENMQVIRQSRLSVSKVSKVEWDFVLGLVDEEETEDPKT